MMMIIRVDDEDKKILVNLRSKNLKFDLFFRILLNENYHSSTEKNCSVAGIFVRGAIFFSRSGKRSNFRKK